MIRVNILDVVNRLSSTLNKIGDFDVSTVKLSDRILDNRIITLEGYLHFLESEGIPKIKAAWNKISEQELTVLEGGKND